MTHTPDSKLHYVVSFSGGKDSVATWLYLTRELKLPRVTCVFADTGHESSKFHGRMGEPCPCLDCYLDLLDREHGLALVRIRPKLRHFIGELKPEKICERLGLDINSNWQDEPLDMERLAILKRRFASTTVRFCTEFLKLHPLSEWVRDNCEIESTIRVSGMRSQESAARALREPFQPDGWTGCMLWLPIKDWLHDDVFAIHQKYGVPPNPLYKMGFGRVGCFPCIMARKEELVQLSTRFDGLAMTDLRNMERRVAAAIQGADEMSFFSAGKTPDRYASHICQNTGKRFPDANDVRLWALNEPPARSGQGMLEFEEDWTEDASQCLSQYGLCE